MIYGIGCDMIEIHRVTKASESDHFKKRVFSKQEQEELFSKKNPPQSAAACFAAKEAFSKAIGTGIREFSLIDISLLHDEKGKPYLFLTGKAQAIANRLFIKQFHVSVSHTKSNVMCVVIAEK